MAPPEGFDRDALAHGQPRRRGHKG
jgi:hypothetical protein